MLLTDYTEMGTEHAYISVGLGICGFFVMSIGAIAIFCVIKLVWVALVAVQAANLLFVGLIVLGAIAGLALGMDVRNWLLVFLYTAYAKQSAAGSRFRHIIWLPKISHP